MVEFSTLNHLMDFFPLGGFSYTMKHVKCDIKLHKGISSINMIRLENSFQSSFL